MIPSRSTTVPTKGVGRFMRTLRFIQPQDHTASQTRRNLIDLRYSSVRDRQGNPATLQRQPCCFFKPTSCPIGLSLNLRFLLAIATSSRPSAHRLRLQACNRSAMREKQASFNRCAESIPGLVKRSEPVERLLTCYAPSHQDPHSALREL